MIALFIFFAYLFFVNLRILTLSFYLYLAYLKGLQIVEGEVRLFAYIKWFLVDILFDMVNWSPVTRLRKMNERAARTSIQ